MRHLEKFLLALALTAAAVTASAQPYPNKPVRLVLPLAAGSAGDVLVRVVVQQMAENIGQPIAVENQAGAAGLIGAERVARAPADGYTLGGFSDSVLHYAPNLLPNAKFDPLTDFAPISLLADISWVLVVNPKMPVTSVQDLVAYAKSSPGKVDYGSAGNGSPHHIVMELFKAATGTSITHIPYKGATQATTDVAGGQVQLMFSGTAVALPFIKDGRLRALAVLGAKRSPLLPDVPTLQEAGVPNFTFTTWLGLYAPKGTPRPVIDRLNAEAAKVIASPKVQERLISMGFEPASSTPEQLATRTQEGFRKVGDVIRKNGIKPD
jgi:tripartite-type tricarboxylate transporter receptor subunit TctC